MSFSLSITEANLMTVVGNFLTAVLPTGTQVVRGQDNRVPLPQGPNWVAMTPVVSTRMATNIDTWDFTDDPAATDMLTYMQADVQVDCFGPLAHDMAQIVLTAFRDDYAVQQIAAAGFDITPLYTSDPRNLSFTNDQDQYEYRWSLDLSLQVNPSLSAPQQFADALAAGIISVDEQYPPTGA